MIHDYLASKTISQVTWWFIGGVARKRAFAKKLFDVPLVIVDIKGVVGSLMPGNYYEKYVHYP